MIKSQKREAFCSIAEQSDLLSPSGMLSHLPAYATDQKGKTKIRNRSKLFIDGDGMLKDTYLNVNL